MGSPYFFTGRKKLHLKDLLVRVWDGPLGTLVMNADLRLERYKLSDEAEVTVDAYSTVFYERLSLGRVGDLRKPVEMSLSGFGRGDRPLFRVKVTEPGTGKLLAAHDRIVAGAKGALHSNRACILHVDWKSNEEMGGELWRVDRGDKVLLLNRDIPGLPLLAKQRDARFEAMVYPAALREILRAAFVEEIDDDIDRETPWYRFAVSLAAEDAPERGENDEREDYMQELDEWIDRVVRTFCTQQQYFQRMSALFESVSNQGDLL